MENKPPDDNGVSRAENNSGHEHATPQALEQLYITATTWLDGNIPPYFVPDDRRSGAVERHNGLPLLRVGLPEQSMQIPGDLIVLLDERAATVLDIQPDDIFGLNYAAAHYGVESGEPVLRESSCEYTIQTSRRDKSEVVCHTGPATHGNNVDWEGDPDTKTTASRQFMTVDECESLIAIAERLEEYRAALIERGEYPEDRGQHYIDRDVSKNIGRLTAQAAQETILAARERLQKVKTVGRVGSQTAWRLATAFGRDDRTYASVPRADVNDLYLDIGNRLLTCDKALYVFDDEIVGRVTPAFADRGEQRLRLNAITLKAESSDNGPVFTFTVTKTALRNGEQKTEVESFILKDIHYIRLVTPTESVQGRPATMQINGNNPMSKSQFDVFQGLLKNWMDPSPTT